MLKQSWTEELPLDETLQLLGDLALRHCRLAGSEGRKIALLLGLGDYRALCDYEIFYDVGDIPVTQVIHARQALGFFQKLEALDLGIDKEAVALEKFIEAETRCAQTNRIFEAWNQGSGRLSLYPDTVRTLDLARRKISRLLGPCPKLDSLKMRFGPGATTDVKKSESCPQIKMSAPLSCSSKLFHSGYLPQVLRSAPHWIAQHVSRRYIDDDGWLCDSVTCVERPGNLCFVPKSAKTYRSIVVEPTLNAYAQQGVLTYMMDRLKLGGIDLTDQTRNQRLAMKGSLTGEISTLDLSSASDCVSTELIRFLLPARWFALLDALRTNEVLYKGDRFRLEKFSSMGNAFTFPLESLVFWALSAAVMELNTPSSVPIKWDQLSIYGDDIICPVEYTDKIVAILESCGFVLNEQKSYCSGPFRESCGCDYYFGFSVRPFYQKHLVSVRSLFMLHNFYVRNGLDDFAAAVLEYIPKRFRLYGPEGFGDGHLLGDWMPKRPKSLQKKGYGGFLFETYALEGSTKLSIYPGDYVSPLYRVYDSGRAPLSPTIPGVLEGPQSMRLNRSGRPIMSVPGTKGYRKLRIYTLSPK